MRREYPGGMVRRGKAIHRPASRRNLGVTRAAQDESMGQPCTLLLEIAADDLGELAAADRRIVLAKPAGRGPHVAWLTFEPRARRTIVWDDRYGVFAARAGARIGARIDVSSCVYPAAARMIYTFDGATFAEARPEVRVPPGHFDIWNAGPSAATFGLLQRATIDGVTVSSPLNAIVLPADFTADFAPVERVYLWAQHGVEPGAVIREVPADAAVIAFDRPGGARTYRYDLGASAFASAAD